MQLNEQGELPIEYLKHIERTIGANAREYRENAAYVRGENPTILNRPATDLPDNRVPVSLARVGVVQMQGYGAKPGYITYHSEANQGKYAQEIKREVLDLNDEEILTSELYSSALSHGYVYELLRMDIDLKIRQYRVEADQGLIIYDDTLDRNKLAFVHLVTITGVAPEDTKDVVTIYYKDHFVEYTRLPKGSFVETDRKDHPFRGVPVIKYRCNAEEMSLFHAVKALMDEFDKIMSSNYSNELERFSSAYLLLANELASGEADEIKSKRIFEKLKSMGEPGSVTDYVAFLTKPSRGEDVAEAADRFEKLIFKTMMVIDFSQETTGNATGEALKQRMIPMEMLTSSCLAYFSRGLQERFVLIGAAYQFAKGIAPEWITIKTARAMPTDLLSIAQAAGMLKGLLSDQSIMSLFPADIVPDVKAELARLQEQAMNRLPELDDDSTDTD